MTEVRLAVVGTSHVGKSRLVYQYIGIPFPEEPVDFEDSYRKQVTLDDNGPTVLFDLLDMHEEDEYSGMRDRYYRVVQGVIIVYSITNRTSFEEVSSYYDRTLRIKDMDSVPAVIVANKCDLGRERVVSSEEGYQLARSLKVPYYETSATENVNIKDVFVNIAEQVINDRKTYYSESKKKKAKKNSLFSRKKQKYQKELEEPLSPIPKAKLYAFSAGNTQISVPNSTYVADFEKLYEDMDFADVKLVSFDGVEISAHGFVIAARCKELWDLIKKGNTSLSVPFSTTVVNIFLKYLYTATFDEFKLNDDEITRNNLFEASKAWKMRSLTKELCAKYNYQQADQTDDSESLLTANERNMPLLNREMRRALVAPSGDKSTFDVIFRVKDDQKIIKAHKALLSARCAYFRAMFTGGTKERDAKEIDMEEVRLPILLSTIEYCYTDDIRYIQDDMVPDLLVGAGKFCLNRLKKKMEAYILQGVTKENAVQVYTFAREYDAVELKSQCAVIIARRLKWISKNDKTFSEKYFSDDEMAYFTELRNKFPDADDIEAEDLLAEKAVASKEFKAALGANGASTASTHSRTNDVRCVLQ